MTTSGPASTETPGERRVWGPLLALVGGPVGHVAIGYWRRACFWLGAVVALEAGIVVAAAGDRPRAMCALLGTVIAVRLAMVVDVVRLKRTVPRPSARTVALLWAGMLAFYTILAMKVRSDVVEFFQIPTQSMSPTLLAGDHIAVKKQVSTLRRGDVVVFRFPHDHEVSYVKRILAVGGDVVELRSGQWFINGAPLPRRPLDQPCPGTPTGDGCQLWEESLDGRRWRIGSDGTELDFPRTVVRQNAYFVVGDLRSASSDSRMWGPVDRELVTGLTQFVWWSKQGSSIRWDRIGKPAD